VVWCATTPDAIAIATIVIAVIPYPFYYCTTTLKLETISGRRVGDEEE
jgi:hypothetical protein